MNKYNHVPCLPLILMDTYFESEDLHNPDTADYYNTCAYVYQSTPGSDKPNPRTYAQRIRDNILFHIDRSLDQYPHARY